MADNYLENQYEKYQARKAAWERERKYGNHNKKKKVSQHPRLKENLNEEIASTPEEENENIPYINTDNDYSIDD